MTLAPPERRERRESLTVRLARHCRSVAMASTDGTFTLGYREVALAIGATASNAATAIGDLVLAGTVVLVAEGRGNKPDVYRLAGPTAASAAGASPFELADRLAAHCEQLAAAAADGRFQIGKVGAAEAIGTDEPRAARALDRLVADGRVIQVRRGSSRVLPTYAMAGSPGAVPDPVAEARATVRCTMCGMEYVPDGPVSACPGTLKWSHLRGLAGIRRSAQ